MYEVFESEVAELVGGAICTGTDRGSKSELRYVCFQKIGRHKHEILLCSLNHLSHTDPT
jgi:hypothetical protein